ncbi:hypothetical protein JRI60_05905 [Archangium violaceum]|uniref:hypothetical protein n=1 Tax=Archangium violaceum TaxID=83451 RepID=UPI0019515784|nr:hypothetical protein [Archangium violaceum]QRN98576.1 hypothetical protein JRI60_05905 [Archangium violaceum]
MKYFCEACERLVPPASYRLEFGLLVVKCSRCKVEMRCGPDVDEAPAPAPATPKTADAPVIMLGVGDAEPDPIENEPTRRVAVPASVLAAIEAEAKENRRKKESPAPAPVAEVKISALEFVAAAKAAAPEPAVARAPAPEPVAAREVLSELPPAKTPAPKFPMSEAAASNLVVLRLADVHGRSSESKPAAEPRPVESKPAAEAPVLRPSIAVRAVSESSADDPFMPPPGYCPKCIGPRKDGTVVCPYCGLEYARFRTDEFRPSPAVASTWLGVQELWESKGAHDKILALASEKGELAGLGRLYRIRLARNPDDSMAKRGREEVLRLATASSTLMPSAPPDKRAKVKTAALGLLFFALVMAAVLIIYQTRRMLAGGP